MPAAADPVPSKNALDSAIEREAYRQRLDVFLSSRESAATLTGEALRGGITLQALTTVAADVAQYADEAIAIVQDEYRPQLDCRAGCAHCCCKPGVLVTFPELLCIAGYVEATLTADERAALTRRAQQYAAQTAAG